MTIEYVHEVFVNMIELKFSFKTKEPDDLTKIPTVDPHPFLSSPETP